MESRPLLEPTSSEIPDPTDSILEPVLIEICPEGEPRLLPLPILILPLPEPPNEDDPLINVTEPEFEVSAALIDDTRTDDEPDTNRDPAIPEDIDMEPPIEPDPAEILIEPPSLLSMREPDPAAREISPAFPVEEPVTKFNEPLVDEDDVSTVRIVTDPLAPC